MALSQWSEQIVRKLELLVNSYADAYRMQIHRHQRNFGFGDKSRPASGRSRAFAKLEAGKYSRAYGYTCMNKER